MSAYQGGFVSVSGWEYIPITKPQLYPYLEHAHAYKTQLSFLFLGFIYFFYTFLKHFID